MMEYYVGNRATCYRRDGSWASCGKGKDCVTRFRGRVSDHIHQSQKLNGLCWGLRGGRRQRHIQAGHPLLEVAPGTGEVPRHTHTVLHKEGGATILRSYQPRGRGNASPGTEAHWQTCLLSNWEGFIQSRPLCKLAGTPDFFFKHFGNDIKGSYTCLYFLM